MKGEPPRSGWLSSMILRCASLICAFVALSRMPAAAQGQRRSTPTRQGGCSVRASRGEGPVQARGPRPHRGSATPLSGSYWPRSRTRTRRASHSPGPSHSTTCAGRRRPWLARLIGKRSAAGAWSGDVGSKSRGARAHRNLSPTARKPAAAACMFFIVSGFFASRSPMTSAPRAAYAQAATPQPTRNGVA